MTAAEATAQEALKQAQVFANLRAVDDIVMSFAIKYSQNPLPVIAPVDDELEKMATAISSKKVVHHKWDSQLFHKKRKELAAKIKKVLKLKKVPYIYIYMHVYRVFVTHWVYVHPCILTCQPPAQCSACLCAGECKAIY